MLETKLDDRAKRRVIREQLGKFLADGEQFKRTSLEEVGVPPPSKEVNQWAEKVSQYLEKEVSRADAVQFLNPPMLPFYTFGIPPAHENIVNGMERRLAVLRQITRQMESDALIGGH